jgi:hypothetical protein
MNKGRYKNSARSEKINPPTLPAASGNQKASLYSPIMNGIKPRIDEEMVRKMGLIFMFHALR